MSDSDQHAPAVPLSRFDHVTLIVADVDASRDFYQRVLGMRPVPRPAFGFPGAWLELHGSWVHLTLADENSGQAGWGDRGVIKTSRGHHLAYTTPDFDAALEAIQAHQVPIASGPQQRPDGIRQVYIHDPDQHLIEVCGS